MVVAAAASPPAPIRNCLRLMAIILPFEVVVKAFSRRLRSEDYGGLLCGVNVRAEEETKVRRHPTSTGPRAVLAVHAAQRQYPT